MSGYLEGILVILLLNIIFAYAVYWPLAAGQLNLGVAGFVGIGAYSAAYAANEYGLPPYLAGAGAALVTFMVAVIIAVPVLRTKGIYLALATFAFGQVLQSLFLNLEVVGGAAGYPVNAYIGIGGIAVCAALVFLVTFYLDRTRFGLNLVAVRNDTAVSDLFGVHVRLYHTLAFAIGAGIAGLGGALYGFHYSYIEPQNYSILFSIFVVLFVLLGGTQTVFGPLLGAVFFTLLPEVLRGSEEWRYAIFAVFIIATMILRPQGLFTVHEIHLFRRLFDGGARPSPSPSPQPSPPSPSPSPSSPPSPSQPPQPPPGNRAHD